MYKHSHLQTASDLKLHSNSNLSNELVACSELSRSHVVDSFLVLCNLYLALAHVLDSRLKRMATVQSSPGI